MSGRIALEGVAKRYGGATAVAALDLDVADGDFLCLLGPSGCGKTTVVRMIAGLEAPTEGRILIGDRVVADSATGAFAPPEARGLGLVFQNYALWPHLSVRRNVDFGLRLRGVAPAARDADLCLTLAPLHPRPAAGRADPRSRDRGNARAHHLDRRHPQPGKTALRLRLPHPLLCGAGAQCGRDAGAAHARGRAAGRLPFRDSSGGQAGPISSWLSRGPSAHGAALSQALPRENIQVDHRRHIGDSPMAWRALRAALLISALAWLPAAAKDEPTQPTHAMIEGAFLRFDPLYLERRATRKERLDELAAALGERENAGHALHCSQQIFLEAKHLIRYTALWDEIDDKLARLEESLDDLDQDWADGQSPVDGHWGLCYERDFLRLGATVAGLQRAVNLDETPRYRLRVLPGLGSPKVLLDRLQTLLISDIAHAGVDNRGELASLLISLSQSVYKKPLARMWNDTVDLTKAEMLGGMAEVFRFFLAGSQDPRTGYWGAWYLTEDGIVKTADLSFTYHIVAYTRGRVEHWPQILETTWRIEREQYPFGWSHGGRWSNHNLYDVARILAYGWPFMDAGEQARWRTKIAAMMDWSLDHTVIESLAFHYDPAISDSLPAEYYFGVSFLDTVGYWRPSKRFWQQPPSTDPDSVRLCRGLAYSLDTLGGGGWHRDAALQKLEQNCGTD